MKLRIGTYIDGRDGQKLTVHSVKGTTVQYYWHYVPESTTKPPIAHMDSTELASLENYTTEHKFTYSKNTAIRTYINLLPR